MCKAMLLFPGTAGRPAPSQDFIATITAPLSSILCPPLSSSPSFSPASLDSSSFPPLPSCKLPFPSQPPPPSLSLFSFIFPPPRLCPRARTTCLSQKEMQKKKYTRKFNLFPQPQSFRIHEQCVDVVMPWVLHGSLKARPKDFTGEAGWRCRFAPRYKHPCAGSVNLWCGLCFLEAHNDLPNGPQVALQFRGISNATCMGSLQFMALKSKTEV